MSFPFLSAKIQMENVLHWENWPFCKNNEGNGLCEKDPWPLSMAYVLPGDSIIKPSCKVDIIIFLL
jgi:hypothetical protein